MTIVYVLLVAHFVGDFLCQTDDMALRKSKDWDALTVHVLVYAFVLYAALLLMAFTLPVWMRGPWAVTVTFYVFINAACHWVQDAVTSRLNARLWFLRWEEAGPKGWRRLDAENEQLVPLYYVDVKPTRHWFFVSIGFDQLLHFVTLIATAQWWLLR